MSRNVRRGGQIWVRIFSDKPVTVRPTPFFNVSKKSISIFLIFFKNELYGIVKLEYFNKEK
ncbi:hypothetical protein Ahy_A03g011887 [Arachis hypogaea]|uniref:Ribosomal protein L10e/L16 domain-containing protein n=1 Tax=Arachis hypogaea TaxID=3818 RepID=A0A445DS65_ARAHY|nr:hypothetical protein Ahy_A03g011887 [Arachis hypogaea]